MPKACTKCGVTKELPEYYRDKKGTDGLSQQCKECIKARMVVWYDAHRDEVIEKVTARAKSNPAARRAYNARARARTTPQEQYARARVNREIKQGRLTRATQCQGCGKQGGRIVAHHHNGYEMESVLDVVWLCTACHLRIHGLVRPR